MSTVSKGSRLSQSSSGSTDVGPVIFVKRDRIRIFKGQPRHYFDPDELNSLARSLKGGQRVPINVKVITGDPDHDYELIDGERRFRAAEIAKLEHLLVWVKKIGSVDEQFKDSVISNFCRAEHTALEKAYALKRLVVDGGMTVREVAENCGYTEAWVYQHMSLLKLEPRVRELMGPDRPEANRLAFSAALRLVPLPPQLQCDVAEEIVTKKVRVATTGLLISTRAHESGHGSSRQPHKDYRMMRGFVQRTIQQTSAFASMPDLIFASMFAARPKQDADSFISEIETSIRRLTKLLNKTKAVSRRTKSK